MSNPVQIQVPVVIQKTTKAVVSSITTGVGVLGLFATSISDGSLSWDEGGVLIGAVATAVATIASVWRVPNEVQSVTMREAPSNIN